MAEFTKWNLEDEQIELENQILKEVFLEPSPISYPIHNSCFDNDSSSSCSESHDEEEHEICKLIKQNNFFDHELTLSDTIEKKWVVGFPKRIRT